MHTYSNSCLRHPKYTGTDSAKRSAEQNEPFRAETIVRVQTSSIGRESRMESISSSVLQSKLDGGANGCSLCGDLTKTSCGDHVREDHRP
jgi:5-methylcytosine-specific restriction endonuclease McrA